MVHFSFSVLLIYFTVYSILGWLFLLLYGLVTELKLQNRGFLAGPYAPLYGLGAMLLLFLFSWVKPTVFLIPLVFLAGVLIAGLLAFFSARLFESVFNFHFWPHQKGKPLIKRPVLLLRAGLFGALGVLLVYVIHPWTKAVLLDMGPKTQLLLSSLCLAAFILDFVGTLNAMYRLREKIEALDALEIEGLGFDPEDPAANGGKVAELSLEEQQALQEKMEALTGKDRGNRRLLMAFSQLYHTESKESFGLLKERLLSGKSSFFQGIAAARKKRLEKQKQAKETNRSFARGLNVYKLFWIFFIGSMAGFFVETIYCYLVHGSLESRQGLLYGPFSQIYGFGAVVMVLFLNRLKEKGERWVFAGSALIGGAFEFFSSLFQEHVFQASSWSYEGQTFAFFGGRTSLLYMFFWGILGVLLMKEIYPRLSLFVERIPNRQGLVLTWTLIVLMSLNIFISTAALWRWSERSKHIPPENAFSRFLDETYPDSRMESVYSSMRFLEGK